MLDATPPPPGVRRRLGDGWRATRRVVLAHRRGLAALLTFVAVAAGLQAVRPPDPATVAVRVAVRDLPAGAVLADDDLATREVAADDLPDGVVDDPVARTLAGPVRRGEPLTDVRLVGPGLLAGHDDLVALPVRLPDPATAALLRVGDRIDLLGTDPRGARPAEVVTRDALVLALPSDGDGSAAAAVASAGLGGRLVVLGVAETDVTRVAAAGVRTFLSLTYSG